MQDAAFHRWVAKAIQECGGNGALYIHSLCGLPSKEALTTVASGMQCPSSFFFSDYFADVALKSAVAPTNKTWLH